MKANNGKGNNPSRDEWETPQKLWDILDRQYGFGFDCCANSDNTKCFDWSKDFLRTHFVVGVAWMNPPFSKARKMFEKFFDLVNDGVAIYRCDNLESRIWQKVIFPNCSWILIPDQRICYEGLDGDGARFASALIGVGVDIPKGLKGTILEVKLLSEV